jgi:hypothetical protein
MKETKKFKNHWIGKKHTEISKEKMRLAKLNNKNRLGGKKYIIDNYQSL